MTMPVRVGEAKSQKGKKAPSEGGDGWIRAKDGIYQRGVWGVHKKGMQTDWEGSEGANNRGRRKASWQERPYSVEKPSLTGLTSGQRGTTGGGWGGGKKGDEKKLQSIRNRLEKGGKIGSKCIDRIWAKTRWRRLTWKKGRNRILIKRTDGRRELNEAKLRS